MDAKKPRGRPPSGGREEVLRATLELLREKGVARLTTREVAERAGVSEGSVFYHFSDRAGLLTAAFQQTLGPMQVGAALGSGGGLRGALLAMSESVQTFLEAGLDVLMAAHADAELRYAMAAFIAENDYGPHHGIDGLGSYLVEQQAAGAVRLDVDPKAVASLVVNDAFQRAALPKLLGRSKGVVDRERFIDTVLTMITPP